MGNASKRNGAFATVGGAILLAVLLLVSASVSDAGVTATRSTAHAGPSTCNGTLASGTVVGMAATTDDGGYWIVNNQGLVVVCGDATTFGGLAVVPNRPIVGIAATTDGGGYYLVASDGGILPCRLMPSFRDQRAAYDLTNQSWVWRSTHLPVGTGSSPSDGGHLSLTTRHSSDRPGSSTLNKPVVGMAASATGGYWLVASDGGIFSDNAPFFGSTGSMRLNKPVVGMAGDMATRWLLARCVGWRHLRLSRTVLRVNGRDHLEQTNRRDGVERWWNRLPVRCDRWRNLQLRVIRVRRFGGCAGGTIVKPRLHGVRLDP